MAMKEFDISKLCYIETMENKSDIAVIIYRIIIIIFLCQNAKCQFQRLWV